MMIINVYGHIVIICIGIPVVSGVVYNLKIGRIQHLLILSNDKMSSPTNCLTRIIAIQGIIRDVLKKSDSITLIGIVNLHVLECQDSVCPCKTNVELFDAAEKKFSSRNINYHKDTIFLKHFIKKLYEDSLQKFNNSTMLRISFSCYLFDTMKNVNAALVELNNASRKNTTIKQDFEIYRLKAIIEDYIKQESTNIKDKYRGLVNVIEFEELLNECQQAIEKVASLQIEFWAQVSNQIPDLNILHDLGNKIFDATKNAEKIWNKLSKINPNYSKALTLYGNYMMEIKNHNQVACDLLERYINLTLELKLMLIKILWK